jgi:hypothetical protein
MKLQRVTFLGIRGIADGSHDFTDIQTGLPHDVVIVTGPEASGKTRFLEAILATKEGIGAYGPMSSGGTWLPPGAVVAKIMVSFWLEEEERQFVGTSAAVVDGEAQFLPDRIRRDADEGLVALLRRYEHSRETGKFEYFPASRRLSPLGPFHGTSALEQRLHRASKDSMKYGFVVRFLRDLDQDGAKEKEFAAILERLSPSCRYVFRASRDGLPRCFSSLGGPPASVAELADSEAEAVLFASTAVNMGLSRSILLVDRPERWASAGRGASLLEGLRGLGEGNQLLIASSSAEMISLVPRDNVVRLGGA